MRYAALMVLTLVLGVALMPVASLPFGGYEEIGFWERFLVCLLAALPVYFVAQPEWERRDAERRQRRQAAHP